jgi:hypothetical protein
MNNPPKTAWVQLYQARQAKAEVVESRTAGRPPSPIPRHKVGFTLSQGEVNEIEAWQERLSALIGRKLSAGETVGILTRICSARYSRMGDGLTQGFDNLVDLVEAMIGEGQ